MEAPVQADASGGGPPAGGYRRKKIKAVLIILTVLAVLVAWLWWWNSDPERRFGFLHNKQASCTNCRSFVHYLLEDYAEGHDGWYPRGGENSLDSLGAAIRDAHDVHLLTCHAWAWQLQQYWQAHKTLSPDYCCYRYNEGLREDDPPGLVVMYYYRPTRWANWGYKAGNLGRPVLLTPPSMVWERLGEGEFQGLQAKTQRYLDERKQRAGDIASIAGSLLLLVHSTSAAANQYRFTAELVNRGKEAFSVRFLDSGLLNCLMAKDERIVICAQTLSGPSATDLLAEPVSQTEHTIPPGGSLPFPGWLEVAIQDAMAGDTLTSRQRQMALKSRGAVGTDSQTFNPPASVEVLNQAEYVAAVVRCMVRTSTIKDIAVSVASRKLYYMALSPGKD